MACQLLSLSGYDPIGICSPASSSLSQKYGSVKTFSYTSADCGETIRHATKGSLKHVVDCITNADSTSTCFTAMGRVGGRYAGVNYTPPEWRTRKAVHVDLPLAYTLWGKEVKLKDIYYREADPAKLDLAMRWRQDIQSLVDQGCLRCHPVHEVHGKWDGMIKGLKILKEGEVRGQKLVVRLGEPSQ